MRCSPALIAAASLLPKQKAPVGIIAAVAVLAFLLVLAEIIQTPDGVSLGWALYVVIVLTFLQAALGIGALLLDAGIISAPVPKPRSTSSRSTASTAARTSTTASTRRTRAGTAAASALPGPVRRRLLGRVVVRWLLRDRPAERPADPADRFPDLRPAAGVAVRADAARPPRSRSRRLRRNQSGNSPS